MSNMESFYGGRQGAAFIIVKRFDGINIPQPGDGSGVTEYTYSANSFAVDNNSDEFLLVSKENGGNYPIDADNNKYLIEKDKDNYKNYAWKKQILDGSQINNTSYVFPTKLAEGMVQCFKKGAKTTSEVNYGEYVLIDTILNSHEYNNPDNGKVFRRGMNIQTELGGAEYIGQIVGPQGESPEIELGKEWIVKTFPGYKSGEYTVQDDDLVPGYGPDWDGPILDYGTYYENVYEEILNNIQNPRQQVLYKVMNGNTLEYEYYFYSGLNWGRIYEDYKDEITYSWVTIRDEFGNVEGALIGFTIPYLVESFVATAVSAYYHRTEEGVPIRNKNLIERIDDGTHGFYQAWQIKVPEGIKGDAVTRLEVIDTHAVKGTLYYSDQEFLYQAGTLNEDFELDTENINYELDYIPIEKDGVVYYIKNDGSGTTGSRMRYTQIVYDRKEEGDRAFIDIGPYNIIKDIWIEANGDVYANYSYQGVKKLEKTHLRWMVNMYIDKDGTYTITYNDGTSDTGGIHVLKDVKLDGDNGNGDQHIKILYSDEEEYTSIGDPLNYILEVTVSESRSESASTKPYHLLVLYSDPVRRQQVIDAEQNAIYRSKYPDKDGNYLRNDWHDMGSLRGAKGGLGIITKFDQKSEMNDDNNVSIPPEYIMYAINQRETTGGYIFEPGVGINDQYTGWMVTVAAPTVEDPENVDLFFYDYSREMWTRVPSGIAGGGGADPAEVVAVSATEPEDPELEEGGLWFILKPSVYAH